MICLLSVAPPIGTTWLTAAVGSDTGTFRRTTGSCLMAPARELVLHIMWRCYRHDYLVKDRRSTVTLICDGAARSCFHTQASLSRSVIGSVGPQAAGPSRSPTRRSRPVRCKSHARRSY